MTLERFSPATLREAKVPHYDDVNGLDIDAVKIRIKLFDPKSAWAWYVAGADPETGTCFGWVIRGQAGGSIAYFQLKDLNAMQGNQGVQIRRAGEWNPQTTLGEVIEEKTT